jgi:hypothetical protein
LLNSEDIGEVKMDYSLAPQSISQFVSNDANVSQPGSGTVIAADPELAMRWTPVDDSLVKKLSEKSAERVNKDPKFAEVRKEIEEIARNKGVTRLAELRKKAEAENKADKKKKNRKEKAKDSESPYIQEGVNIGADMVTLKSGATMGSL